jgi:hypothetical protein
MICGCACMQMENMKAHDTAQKEMATRKKDERITQIELEEKQARACNAATKEMGNAGGGQPTGTHPISALPGDGGGQPVVGPHPVGTDTGTGTDQSIGDKLMSALPGHGSGKPVVGSHTVGNGTDTGTGTGHPTGNHPISTSPRHGTGTGNRNHRHILNHGGHRTPHGDPPDVSLAWPWHWSASSTSDRRGGGVATHWDQHRLHSWHRKDRCP